MPKIIDKYGLANRPRTRFGSKYDETIPYVGFEVEVENVRNLLDAVEVRHHDFDATRVAADFVVKTDGSLRNHGAEIVTNVVMASDAVDVFEKIIDSLKEDKYDFSNRTSIHVHLNVLDFDPKQLKALIYLYLVIEPLLYKFIAPHRRNNIYCNRLSETYNRLPEVSGWSKYTGFNLCTVETIGTVEFRHLEGTDDVRKFRTWINIISDLYNAAYQYGAEGFEKLFNRITGLNTDSDYLVFLQGVLPNSLTELMQEANVYDLHAELYNAVAYVKSQRTTSFETHVNKVGLFLPKAIVSSKDKPTGLSEIHENNRRIMEMLREHGLARDNPFNPRPVAVGDAIAGEPNPAPIPRVRAGRMVEQHFWVNPNNEDEGL